MIARGRGWRLLAGSLVLLMATLGWPAGSAVDVARAQRDGNVVPIVSSDSISAPQGVPADGTGEVAPPPLPEMTSPSAGVDPAASTALMQATPAADTATAPSTMPSGQASAASSGGQAPAGPADGLVSSAASLPTPTATVPVMPPGMQGMPGMGRPALAGSPLLGPPLLPLPPPPPPPLPPLLGAPFAVAFTHVAPAPTSTRVPTFTPVTLTSTVTATRTATTTASPTITVTGTTTTSVTPTVTSTPTRTPTATATSTVTPTPTNTPIRGAARLYVGDFQTLGQVTTFPLTPVTGDIGTGLNTFTSGVATEFFAIAINPSGTRLFVGNYASSDITVFTVNASGDFTFSTVTALPSGASGPRGLAVNAAGTRLYVANGAGSNNITTFRLNTAGDIVAGSGVNTALPTGATFPFGLVLSPNNQRLYTLNQGIALTGNNLTRFVLTASGDIDTTVTATNITLPTGGLGPTLAALNPAGTRLYITNQGSTNANGLSVFDVSASGDLSNGRIVALPTGASVGPVGITVNPLGNALYVANFNGAAGTNIDVFALDASGDPVTPGTLVAMPTGATGAFDLRVNTTSPQRLYVTNVATNNVTAFTLDAAGNVVAGSGVNVPLPDGALSPTGLLVR